MENYKKKLKIVSNSSLSSHWSCLKTPIKCNMSRIKDLNSKFTVSAQQFSNTFHIEEPQIIPTMKNKPEMGGVAVDSKEK